MGLEPGSSVNVAETAEPIEKVPVSAVDVEMEAPLLVLVSVREPSWKRPLSSVKLAAVIEPLTARSRKPELVVKKLYKSWKDGEPAGVGAFAGGPFAAFKVSTSCPLVALP